MKQENCPFCGHSMRKREDVLPSERGVVEVRVTEYCPDCEGKNKYTKQYEFEIDE